MDLDIYEEDRAAATDEVSGSNLITGDAQASGCGRFAAGMMVMVAVTVTLILSHARNLALPWLALLPLGVGLLLLLYLHVIGLWTWK